jgi:hypothetical protein
MKDTKYSSRLSSVSSTGFASLYARLKLQEKYPASRIHTSSAEIYVAKNHNSS